MRILIRCDGSTDIGMGHVVRCLVLADEFVQRHGAKVTFAMLSGKPGFDLVKRAGHTLESKPSDVREDAWVADLVLRGCADAVVFDARTDFSPSAVRDIKNTGVLMVDIDDPCEKRLAADLVFYPPFARESGLSWAGFGGELFAGWEWVILGKGFSGKPSAKLQGQTMVLVTTGGSDPQGLLFKVIAALDKLAGNFISRLVIGPAFARNQELEDMLSHSKRSYEVLRDVKNMPDVMAQADLAIASFGVTAYELAAVGVPAVYICLTRDHELDASVFVENGMAVSLGLSDKVSEQMLGGVVDALLHDKPALSRMAKCAAGKVDGRGAERVAAKIVERLHGRR